MAKTADALAGKTFHFKFTDGPTAGSTYEHTFRKNGTVAWRSADPAPRPKPKAIRPGAKTAKKKPEPAPRYASFQIAPGVHLMSYLSNGGYTLTLALNLWNGQLHGFASNDKEWFPVSGTVKEIQK